MRGGVSARIAPNAPHHVILYNSDFSFTSSRDVSTRIRFPEQRYRAKQRFSRISKSRRRRESIMQRKKKGRNVIHVIQLIFT